MQKADIPTCKCYRDRSFTVYRNVERSVPSQVLPISILVQNHPASHFHFSASVTSN
jgi:hypothetical protein